MKIYICNKCGKTVAHVPAYRYRHTELDYPAHEIMDENCCCGGEFEEAGCCKSCGEYAGNSKMTNGFCERCVLLLEARFETLMKQFTPDERETINWLKDGERL